MLLQRAERQLGRQMEGELPIYVGRLAKAPAWRSDGEESGEGDRWGSVRPPC